MLSVHCVLLCMPIINDSVDKSMKKGFILFSHDDSQVLSPFVQFCLKELVIQSVEMSYNTDLWTKTLKTMRLKVGLTSFHCLNEGLRFPKLGMSTVVLGKCNILSTFEKHSSVSVFKYTFINLHLQFAHLESWEMTELHMDAYLY